MKCLASTQRRVFTPCLFYPSPTLQTHVVFLASTLAPILIHSKLTLGTEQKANTVGSLQKSEEFSSLDGGLTPQSTYPTLRNTNADIKEKAEKEPFGLHQLISSANTFQETIKSFNFQHLSQVSH